ncbi:MATE family efflux transporter [Scatolibacter rhodanostii]|uniref:MATE family efflux transporter n=1 Tax=Scatolibacter rhodanostii TaxID=2014781 RepID=UPI0013565689|nr:MATE family efflux transporter [Scatolibacter rhodanostii]
MTDSENQDLSLQPPQTKQPFLKNLLSLAIPFALQNLIAFAMGFTDNLMVGQLGDDAISGIYMGNQPQIFLQMVIGGIEGAILILAAQYWGKNDTSSIRKVVSIGIKLAGAFGLVVSLVAATMPYTILTLFTKETGVLREGTEYLRFVGASYLFFSITQILIAAMRSVESARIGLYISLIGYALDCFLNYIMIFGKLGLPAMGVKGAAVSTLISRTVEMVIVIFYVFKVDKRLRLKLKDLASFDSILFRDFIRYGLPVIGGNLVWSINNLAQSAIFGSFNSAGVIAAASIAGSLHSLIYVWMNGLSSAVGIITGKMIGAKASLDAIKKHARQVQTLFVFVGIFSGLFIFFMSNRFISLYKITPEAYGFAKQFINVISISIIGTCYQAACLFGLVKSGGDISFVFKMDTFFVFVVVLPSALLAIHLGAPPWVVFACLKCDQILKCFVAVVKINRFNWMKNLTRESSSIENGEAAILDTPAE